MADVTYCPHCGMPVAGDAARCATCGAALHQASPPTPARASAADIPAGPTAQPTPSASASAPPAAPAAPPTPQQPSPAYPSYPAYPGYSAPPYYSAPGYPAQPQGAPPTGPYPYAYPWMYPYPYYPIYPQRPRRAPGETYALVVSWIVTVAGGLSILCGLFLGLIAVVLASQGRFTSLAAQDIVLVPLITTLLGGSYALFAGISGIRRQRSPRFSLPRPWLFVGLTAVALVAGVLLWQTQIETGPGDSLAVWPLDLLSGVLPALALLSFVTWRLRLPASRRHVWLSVFYGLTLGPLLAIILEVIASLVIDSASLTNPGSLNPNDPSRVIRLLVEISVAAPLIEEMVKPLGAVLLMPRLRTASSAFLVGLAGGVGFDMFETTFTYIGTVGEADWVTVAIERVGASILHGLGAGMVALGWYYIFHGEGVSQRWLRVLGCFGYAVAQHAVNNAGGILVQFTPGPVGGWFAQPFYLGRLPLQIGILPFLGFDVLLFAVLVVVTGRLAKGEGAGKQPSPTTFPQPALQSPLPASAAAGGMPS